MMSHEIEFGRYILIKELPLRRRKSNLRFLVAGDEIELISYAPAAKGVYMDAVIVKVRTGDMAGEELMIGLIDEFFRSIKKV